MKNNKHLIVINTYNRVEELNKTLKSIKKERINADICVISKGNEKEDELIYPVKYFIKTENIGREPHGYIYAFLKYPNYKVYTFLQDYPLEKAGSYYGNKIKKGEKLILTNKADFTTGMSLRYDTDSGSVLCGNPILQVSEIGRYFGIKKEIWQFNPGACFSIDGEVMRKNKQIFNILIKKLKTMKMFPWEMEKIWISLAKRPYLIKKHYIKRLHIQEKPLKNKEFLEEERTKISNFLKEKFPKLNHILNKVIKKIKY